LSEASKERRREGGESEIEFCSARSNYLTGIASHTALSNIRTYTSFTIALGKYVFFVILIFFYFGYKSVLRFLPRCPSHADNCGRKEKINF